MEATKSPTPTVGADTSIANDWYVRPLKPEDEDGTLALYERAFRRPRDRSHWRWKLRSRPAPFNLLWVAVTASDSEGPGAERVIGHYGGIPVRLKLGDRIHEAVHAVEAMTDPQFRRQGMLTALGGTAHATWADSGQYLVTGLPNEQWGTRNRALGYLPLFPLSWLRFPLHLERALLKRKSVPVVLRLGGYAPFLVGSAAWRAMFQLRNTGTSGDVKVRIASEPEDIFDQLWEHASPGWTNVQVRDNEWVRWRYLRAAPNPYEVAVAWRQDGTTSKPVGYVAYRVVEHDDRKNGYIADLFVSRDDFSAASALIGAALTGLSRQGAGSVMTLAPPGSALYQLLRKCGFLPTHSKTAFNFEIVPLDSAVSVDALRDPRHWHLTGGDFDVI